MMASASSPGSKIARFILVSADAPRLALFYCQAFGFQQLSSVLCSSAAMECLTGTAGAAQSVVLGLGAQTLEILQFEQSGRPYPENSEAADVSFQHFAIVVGTIAAAFTRLSTTNGWQQISQGGPVQLPSTSGNVTAYKFRDPEGHPLELIEFAPQTKPRYWYMQSHLNNCIGIDHSAIVVTETVRSIAFYERLGFQLKAHSLNIGAEQARLDDISSPHVEVSALMLMQPTPHLELLCYGKTRLAHSPPTQAHDIAATRVVLALPEPSPLLSGGACSALLDPDGHHLSLVPLRTGGPFAYDLTVPQPRKVCLP